MIQSDDQIAKLRRHHPWGTSCHGTYPVKEQSCHLKRLPIGPEDPTQALSTFHVRKVKPGVWVSFLISPVYKICRAVHKIETPQN